MSDIEVRKKGKTDLVRKGKFAWYPLTLGGVNSPDFGDKVEMSIGRENLFYAVVDHRGSVNGITGGDGRKGF